MSRGHEHFARKPRLWVLGTAVVAAALVVSVGAAFSANASQAAAAKKKPKPFHATCVKKRDHVTRIKFRAADGVLIAGMFFGRGKTTVILGHQSDSTLCTWVPFARRLKRMGYQAFAIDFRGYGASSRRRGRLNEGADMAAAAKVARARGKTVILMGASLGGAAALVAAPQLTPSPPVISLSGPGDFGSLNAIAAVHSASFPVLLAAASEDSPFAEDAQKMYDAALTTDKKLQIVPGFDHGLLLLIPPSSATILPLVDAFLASHAAPAAP